MFLRSLAILTLTSTLALGLTACGDDKNDDTTTITATNPTNNPSGASQSDTSAATDPATDGTGDTTNIVTGSASEGTDTTANPSEPVTTTVSTTTPGDTSGETGPDPSATEPATTEPETTDPTVGTSTTGDPGVPGSVYGPCDDGMPPCQDGADCLTIMGLEGNFCSPSCAMMAACPDNPGGSAMPQCVLTMEGSMDPVNCALVCDPAMGGGQCPGGTSCKQLPAPNDMFGLCTAP